MEIPDTDDVLLQSFRHIQSLSLKEAISSDPEKQPEPDEQPQSNQETQGPRSNLSPQDLIESRLKQLHSRHFLLLQMRHFRKKAEDNNGGTTGELTSEDSDKLCELEAIQKELEELLVKREELEKQGKSASLSNGHEDAHPAFCKPETPCGGIYLLPPPELTVEEITLEDREKTGPVEEAEDAASTSLVPVDSLGATAAVTQCPSCQEVVVTETSSKVGEAMWMLCCLFSMMGGVAGCCLIPFFMDRLRDVHHQCPKCQGCIHIYEPF